MMLIIYMQEELFDGEEIARCPSCSLMVRVIYDRENFTREDEEIMEFSVTVS